MGKFSKTEITMTTDQARVLLIEAWDEAVHSAERLLPKELLTEPVQYALHQVANVFEDHLLKEWGIRNEVSEDE